MGVCRPNDTVINLSTKDCVGQMSVCQVIFDQKTRNPVFFNLGFVYFQKFFCGKKCFPPKILDVTQIGKLSNNWISSLFTLTIGHIFLSLSVSLSLSLSSSLLHNHIYTKNTDHFELSISLSYTYKQTHTYT